jgi:hypothetical protein
MSPSTVVPHPSTVVCSFCNHSFKNEKLMLRHQSTSKTCLHKRGINTESEDLNTKVSLLNEELRRERDKNEILLNKLNKLGNIISLIKPSIDELLTESLYSN